MRIKMCGDTCIQITDRASGITCVGTGSTQPVILNFLYSPLELF